MILRSADAADQLIKQSLDLLSKGDTLQSDEALLSTISGSIKDGGELWLSH
jgi:hypothetical protein